MLQDELVKVAANVTDALALLLPRAYEIDPQLGKAWLRIKRDVHNLRSITAERIDAIACLAPRALVNDLHRFTNRVAELAQISGQFDLAYSGELEIYQRAVMQLSAHPNIATAIQIINPKFAAALTDLNSFDQIGANRKSSQIATTLLRYGLRAIHKTSPLSSLGLVGLVKGSARLSGDYVSDKIDISGPVRRTWQVQLRVLAHVFDQLTADPAALSRSAPIRLNRSLVAQDGEWLWSYPKPVIEAKVAVSGTRAIEARTKSGFVRLLVQILASTGPLSQSELRARAISTAPKVAENFESLLRQAWLSKVIELAVPENLPEFERVRIAVAAQSAERRLRLLPLLEACAAALQATANPAAAALALRALQAAVDLPESPLATVLVDDCMFDAGAISGIEAAFPGPIAQFETLVRLIPVLTSAEPMRAIEHWLKARLIAEVGEGGTVPVAAAFIEAAAKALEAFLRLGPSADGSQDSFFARLGVARDPMLVAALNLLLGTLLSGARDGITRLSCAEANRILDAVPSTSVPARLSKLIYYHPVREDTGAMTYVVNSIYPGYVSMFSRFIAADSAELTAARDYLNASAAPGGFAELGGHFGFNANDHPKIAEQTVTMPPFHFGADAAVNLADLAIAHNPATNALEFIDAAGRRIDLHFFGVIQPFMLPVSYLVVQAISQSVVRVPKLDVMLIERSTPSPQGLIVAPRVVLDDLVISRRCTAVPLRTLPDPRVPDSVFFKQFNLWADQAGLPERMFYRFAAVAAFRPIGDASQTMAASARQDKPMPLDRASPELLRLFQKDLKSTTLDVLFSEALPDFSQSIFARDGDSIIGEIGLELTVSSRS